MPARASSFVAATGTCRGLAATITAAVEENVLATSKDIENALGKDVPTPRTATCKDARSCDGQRESLTLRGRRNLDTSRQYVSS